MACRKCGSSWVTKQGRDCASCPRCCKLQRCKARKQGRIASAITKDCKACGKQFNASGPSVDMSRFCGVECRKSSRREYIRKRRSAIRSGAWPPVRKLQHRRLNACVSCGGSLSKGQEKYCCKACFFDARKSGVQSWDRAAIDKAARSRPRNMSGLRSWMLRAHRIPQGMHAMFASAQKPDGESEFMAFLSRIPARFSCKACSNPCCLPLASSECLRCRKKAANRKSAKRVGGKNDRQRCRKAGVRYDPSVRRRLIFEMDDYTCHVCKRKTLSVFTKVGRRVHPRSPTVDHHPYPLSVGVMGHEWGNVRCACWECNTLKGAEWSGQLPLFR